MSTFLPSLENFSVLDKPKNIKIKDNNYLVIAYRYDLYGQYTYVYIEQPTGKLKIIVWQDNHKDAQPYIFDLIASVSM